MELGIYTFGDLVPDPVTGKPVITPKQRIDDVLAIAKLADEAGLDKLACETPCRLPAFPTGALDQLGRPSQSPPHTARKLLIRRKVGQAGLIGCFEIQEYAVSQFNCSLDVLKRGAGDKFQVDVASVALLQPQPLDCSEHLLHGGVGVRHDAGGEEQPVNTPLLLEGDKRSGQLVGLEGGALALDRT
jgi:hypothetical protein